MSTLLRQSSQNQHLGACHQRTTSDSNSDISMPSFTTRYSWASKPPSKSWAQNLGMCGQRTQFSRFSVRHCFKIALKTTTVHLAKRWHKHLCTLITRTHSEWEAVKCTATKKSQHRQKQHIFINLTLVLSMTACCHTKPARAAVWIQCF